MSINFHAFRTICEPLLRELDVSQTAAAEIIKAYEATKIMEDASTRKDEVSSTVDNSTSSTTQQPDGCADAFKVYASRNDQYVYCDPVTTENYRAGFQAGWEARDTMRESGWRSIESAPKDGTWILLTEENEVFTGHWCKYSNQWRDYGDIGCNGATEVEPTYWMQLPEIPRRG